MTEILENVEQAETPVQSPQGEPANDMLSKTMVSKIVERERLKAYEKGKQEALMELQQDQQQEQQPIQQEAPVAQPLQRAAQGMGGMAPQSPPGMSQEAIEQLIMQKAPEALMQQFNDHKQKTMVNAFVDKMQAAEQRFPGLEEKLNKLNYQDPAMHSLIEMANNLENTGDVINELVSNPSKMIQVLSGIRDQPYLSQETLRSLSNSIKQNQEAAAENSQAREPMSKLKPSISAGLADESQLSVLDLQKMLSKRR
jgi:hypothetical protein